MSIEQAEVMLLAWGEYMRGGSNNGSGVSILGRIIDEGPSASHSTITGLPHMPKIVEIVECCMLEIPKPMLRACKYRFIGLEPDEIAAKKQRVSLDIYQSRINQAVHFVSDYVAVY